MSQKASNENLIKLHIQIKLVRLQTLRFNNTNTKFDINATKSPIPIRYHLIHAMAPTPHQTIMSISYFRKFTHCHVFGIMH